MNNLSYRTALARKSPSAPMKWLFDNYGPMFKGCRCLDFGCGKGFDANYYGLDKYDPYYFPSTVLYPPSDTYDWIFCNYVLNVVRRPEQEKILREIQNLLKPKGGAFVTVRRNCKMGFTKSKTYQDPNVHLMATSYHHTRDYETYFFVKGTGQNCGGVLI